LSKILCQKYLIHPESLSNHQKKNSSPKKKLKKFNKIKFDHKKPSPKSTENKDQIIDEDIPF
jgi:hypothetical protein